MPTKPKRVSVRGIRVVEVIEDGKISSFRFHLWLSRGTTQPLEFDLAVEDALVLGQAIHQSQVKYRLPIPRRARVVAKTRAEVRRLLRVVESDDASRGSADET